MNHLEADNMSTVSTVSAGYEAPRNGRRTAEEETARTMARLKNTADYEDRQRALALMADCNMLMMHECLNFDQLGQKLRAKGIKQEESPRYMNGLELMRRETDRDYKELIASHPVARKVKLCNCSKL